MRASATYFYTYLQNVITFDFSGFINPATDPFGRFGGYRNTKGGIARGVELSSDANVTRSLTVSAAYTIRMRGSGRPSLRECFEVSLRHKISSQCSWSNILDSGGLLISQVPQRAIILDLSMPPKAAALTAFRA